MEIRRNETNLQALLDENVPAYSFEKDGQKYIAAIFPCSADEYLASEYRRADVSADDLEGADIYYMMIFSVQGFYVSVYPELMYGGNVYSTFLSAPFSFITVDGQNYQFYGKENASAAYADLNEIRETAQYLGKSTIGPKTYVRDPETGEWSPFAPTKELEITDIDTQLDLYLIDDSHIIGIEPEPTNGTDMDGNPITYEVYYPFVHFATDEEANDSMMSFFAYKPW